MRLSAFVSFAVLAPAVFDGTAAAPTSRFNGAWTVSMVKHAGLCAEESFRYAIVIREGDIRYRPDPGDAPMNFSGRVDPNGRVQISAARGPARVRASGQLDSSTGSGSWRLPLLGCTGHWTAQRTAALQASP